MRFRYDKYSLAKGVRKVKTNTAVAVSALALAVSGGSGLAFAYIGVTHAASSTVVVTPAHTQGWSTADTRPGGQVQYVNDTTSPYPPGALELTTNATNEAKAQYMHAAKTLLADVTELSYSTKQVSGPAVADPSYQLAVELNGTSGFTTFVYEPYWNGTVTPGTWQQWNAASGNWWSSSTVTCDATGQTITKAPGGPPSYTLASIESACPNAVVVGFGVNVGTYNPSYVVETDGVDFNGTTYDFQLANAPTDKNQCKDNGYQNLTDQTGHAFPNQGQCVSWFEHNVDGHGR